MQLRTVSCAALRRVVIGAPRAPNAAREAASRWLAKAPAAYTGLPQLRTAPARRLETAAVSSAVDPQPAARERLGAAVSMAIPTPPQPANGASGVSAPREAPAPFVASAGAATPSSGPVAAAKRPRRERVAPVVITASAAQRIKHLLSERSPPAKGVRLGVRTRGCNGLSYTMKYVDEVSPKDEVVTQHDVTVFVDPKALFYVVGTTMDFVEDDLRSEFVFVNPNQKGSCGCGESFNV